MSRLVDVAMVSLGGCALCATLLQQCTQATAPIFVSEAAVRDPNRSAQGNTSQAEMSSVEGGGLKLLLKLFNAMTSVALQLKTPALHVPVLRSLFFYLLNSNPICRAFRSQDGLNIVAGAAILTAEMQCTDTEKQHNCLVLLGALAVLAEGARGNDRQENLDTTRLSNGVSSVVCSLHCLFPQQLTSTIGDSLQQHGLIDLVEVLTQDGVNQGILVREIPYVLDVLLRKLAFQGGDNVRTAVVSGLTQSFSPLKSSPSNAGLQAQFDAALRSPQACLLYTSPSPRDRTRSRMPSSA
eukprot:TRINITY_DN34559_c0_g1_i1.p1 TRINITY_DN34559_c0_g1~~TRINITY_DN34559_c0_g1_i1.p1  ORF type:complete len:296 (-),score=92.61 TRINITY_DN34559_c0_g1_i1:39-926(-)